MGRLSIPMMKTAIKWGGGSSGSNNQPNKGNESIVLALGKVCNECNGLENQHKGEN